MTLENTINQRKNSESQKTEVYKNFDYKENNFEIDERIYEQRAFVKELLRDMQSTREKKQKAIDCVRYQESRQKNEGVFVKLSEYKHPSRKIDSKADNIIQVPKAIERVPYHNEKVAWGNLPYKRYNIDKSKTLSDRVEEKEILKREILIELISAKSKAIDVSYKDYGKLGTGSFASLPKKRIFYSCGYNEAIRVA